MAPIYWLNQIQPNHRHTIADKAFYLSYLMQHHHPVPSGFVVATHLFWEFLETIEWVGPLLLDWPHSALYFPVDDARQLQTIAQSIRRQIIAAPLQPELVSHLEIAAQSLEASNLIVRPALASPQINTTKLLDAHLCPREISQISLALKRAWAEFFRARNLFYWQRSGIHLRQLQPTVLIQSIAPSIASGIIEITPTNWIIEATFGLGLSLVWGHVIPDLYQVDSQTHQIHHRQLGQKTLAYNLSTTPDLSTSSEFQLPHLGNYHPHLQRYLLTEAEQNQYALDDPTLETLIMLIQGAISDLGSASYFEWTLTAPTLNQPSNFYITQANTTNRLQREPSSPRSAFFTQPSPSPSSHLSPPQTNQMSFPGQVAAPGVVTGRVTIVSDPLETLETFPTGTILVASVILPQWLAWVSQAQGIITEQGGLTSHGAILARELGIPAVVGVQGITTNLKTGETVTVDGNQGIVYRGEPPETEANLEQKTEIESPQVFIRDDFSFPLGTQLLANISQAQYLPSVSKMPIDGIGLLRSEFMLANFFQRYAPRQWLSPVVQAEFSQMLRQFLQEFAIALHPRPIWYRFLDLRDFLAKEQDSELQLNRWIFLELELKVLGTLYKSGHSNLHLLFPFLRDLSDFIWLKQQVEQAELVPQFPIKIWIMAEVPSVLFLLPEYVKAGVQGISIGTHDLSQLLLGIDRHQNIHTPLASPHPVLMQAIEQLICQAQVLDIPCSICGDLPSLYPQTIESLIEWGITAISVNYHALAQTYQRMGRAEKRLLLKVTRQVEKKRL